MKIIKIVLIITSILFLFYEGNAKKKTFIKNEYWNSFRGPIAYNGSFNYFSFNDSTFVNTYGYSRGIYVRNDQSGKYYYNQETNIIQFQCNEGNTYQMKIESYTDSSVLATIEFKNEAPETPTSFGRYSNGTYFFTRKVGCIAKQNWSRYENEGSYDFSFEPFGWVSFTVNNIRYTAEYSMIDDVLFLKINSKSTTHILPAIHTHLRVNMKDKTINENDLHDLMNNKFHDWEFSDNEFHYQPLSD